MILILDIVLLTLLTGGEATGATKKSIRSSRCSMKNRYRDLTRLFTKEHSLCILSDVAGSEHVILCLHRAEIVSNEFFINDTIRRSCDRKIPSSGKPRSLAVSETFKHFSTIAAQIFYDAVIDGFLSGREHIRVKVFCLYPRINFSITSATAPCSLSCSVI